MILLNINKETYKKRMQWKHLKAIEKMKNGDRDPELIEKIIIRFMVDDNGQYLAPETAIALLDEASAEEIEETFTKLSETMKEAAVPNLSASPSKSPSEVISVDSPSLIG